MIPVSSILGMTLASAGAATLLALTAPRNDDARRSVIAMLVRIDVIGVTTLAGKLSAIEY